MARSVVIKSIDRRAGKTYIRYGDTELEIPGGLPEVKQWVRDKIDEGAEELVVAIFLACLFARDADLTNPAQIVGRTLTLNLAGRLDLNNAVLRVT